MTMKILDDCISCAACEPVCPTEAVFEGDVIFEIEADKCVECEGYFDTNQCVDVCPVDCIVQAQLTHQTLQYSCNIIRTV